jgi:ATP-binding cassette subfamily C (CFTR/MRP) protein 1
MFLMDNSHIVSQEFDTPHNLFKIEGGFFRGMCERSNISLNDIETSKQD